MRAATVVVFLPVLLAISASADEPEAGDTLGSVWNGVYTEAQARRGEFVYPPICGKCHGHKLDGAPDDPDMLPAPPIAGPKFLRNWNGSTLAALFEYTRTTMPSNNPGAISDRELTDVLSYMLEVGGMPAGEQELLPVVSALAGIAIGPEPSAAPANAEVGPQGRGRE